jgi:hypothetical protein
VIAPFEASRLKVQRARTHIAELAAGIGAYLGRCPFHLIVEPFSAAPHLQMHAWTMRISEPIPFILSPILGDAIHNLRSALDLLACDLVRMSCANDKGVLFPFCENAADLGDMIKRRRLHRAGRDVVDVLMSLKPYKGGNAALRAIHDLDVDDKHKALIPAIGAAVTPPFGLQLGQHVNSIPSWNSAIEYDGQMLLVLPQITNMKIGDSVPASFNLVFPKGTAIAGSEIIESLHSFARLTDDIVNNLARLRPGPWPAGYAPDANTPVMRRALLIGTTDK